MAVKTVQDSMVTVVQQMMNEDANLAGNVHGGVIMKLIDNTAGIVGTRHTGKNVVTASIDRMDFHSPVFIGDLLRIRASINHVGNTSMEIGVRVEAENVITGERRHTGSAYLTFVCLDENHKPIKIPPITFETEKEQERNCEAKKRIELRKRQRQESLDKICY